MKLLYTVSILLVLLPLFLQAQNVGIGTASPQHKLVVEGDRILLQNKANDKSFHIRTDGDEIDITTIGSHFWITAENDKHIILNPSRSSSGNIGIGTTHPTEKLHVAGAVKIQSLEGDGNRILYTTPSGVLQTSTISPSTLQSLKEKIAQQEALIEELIERIELLEQ